MSPDTAWALVIISIPLVIYFAWVRPAMQQDRRARAELVARIEEAERLDPPGPHLSVESVAIGPTSLHHRAGGSAFSCAACEIIRLRTQIALRRLA